MHRVSGRARARCVCIRRYFVEHYHGHFVMVTNADGAQNYKIVHTPVQTPTKCVPAMQCASESLDCDGVVLPRHRLSCGCSNSTFLHEWCMREC